MYLSNSIRNIQSTISILRTDIKNLNTWSKNNGLVFYNDKLIMILFTSKRTTYDQNYLMKSNDKSIKQKPTAKLLSITFDCNLTWNEQINIIMKSTYCVLGVLKSFKCFTLFTTHKSSLNYLFYHKLIIAMLFMLFMLFNHCNDYSEFRTVL